MENRFEIEEVRKAMHEEYDKMEAEHAPTGLTEAPEGLPAHRLFPIPFNAGEIVNAQRK